ncbi:coiled-coil domain-containing protein [Clarias magur]|uniref:Coiled-coil domain-containing protein n=1 Tax=Clarias magur TaxID=1594786 RepID=A0A8J4XKP6_CLAMG|nr:coiled-coil domain-containing protein [Clarias magur]
MAASSTDSSQSDALRRQAMLSDGLVKFQHGFLISKVMGQDFPCEYSAYDISNFYAKFTKESWASLKKKSNMYCGLDKQTLELMQAILSRTEVREDDAGLHTLGFKVLTAVSPQANTDNTELENFQVDCKDKRNSHLSKNCSDQSNVNNTESVSSSEFIEALREKLQQKDTENQQIVRLLVLKHHELVEISKLREVETQLMTERLKCEEQRNVEVTKKFNHVFEGMKEQLSMAKSKNEHVLRQLRAILEKYERLRRRADSIKKLLTEERTERKRFQKEFKKTQQMSEELVMNRTLLEDQRDAAKRELSEFRKTMKTVEEQHSKLINAIQRLKDERSSMRADYGILKGQFNNTQVENQQLTQALQTKELEKKQIEKSVQGSQILVKQLYEELDDSKMQRETAEKQLDTMKKELQEIHDGYKVKTLQLQEEHESCMQQLEAERSECETLREVISKLKKDKHVIQEELQCLQHVKAQVEAECKKEGERLREAVSLLEHERKLLLDEMGDLRKDYFSLSDRITQRLEQLEQTDVPMSITDISSSRQIGTSETNYAAGQTTPNMDMIEHIRRKLEEEENNQQKCHALKGN